LRLKSTHTINFGWLILSTIRQNGGIVRAGFKGGGREPGPQASHRQRASRQTLHILFLAHDSCLRNCDLVIMDACVRHASTRHPSFIDQFIAALDQRLQAYKLLAGQYGCFGCLSTLSTEELLTAANTLVDSYAKFSNDLDNSFVDELCHFAKFADIFKDDEPGNISTELFLYKLIINKVCRTFIPMLRSR